MALLDGYRRRRFLTAEERAQIEAGLASAAGHTRARLHLYIDDTAAPEASPRARQCFSAWRLDPAERETAVLVYVSAASWTHAVIGGEEIRRVAPAAFWEVVDSELRRHFAERRFCDGIFKALSQVAIQLKHHYPAAP
ncbi:MAG: TPM domain-containing protein [Candidatus Methylomirabilota bacterium]